MRAASAIRKAVLCLAGTLSCAGLASAGSLSTDFESGLPAGTSLAGNASIVDGALQLTDAANSQVGSFSTGVLDAGPVGSFVATFQMRISDQTCCGETGPNGPADGMSFNFSHDVADPPFGAAVPEEGLPIGLSVNFDTWDNGAAEAPAIDVKMDGVSKGSFSIFPYTGPRFVDVSIVLDPDGTLDVDFDGQDIFTDLQTGHTETEGATFVFGARTGGANSKHLVDNLSITTRPVPEPSSIALGLLVLGGLLAGGKRWGRRNS